MAALAGPRGRHDPDRVAVRAVGAGRGHHRVAGAVARGDAVRGPGRARCTYALTSQGAAAVGQEADRMAFMAAAARERLPRRADGFRPPSPAVTP